MKVMSIFVSDLVENSQHVFVSERTKIYIKIIKLFIFNFLRILISKVERKDSHFVVFMKVTTGEFKIFPAL